jgi:6-phosphofructokinase 1
MDTKIKTLGACTIKNPAGYEYYNTDDAMIAHKAMFENQESSDNHCSDRVFFEQAGPREKIFFNSSEVTAGIVTCGGLCPGVNDVIRALVMELHYRYNVKRILGFRYGYQGLAEKYGHTPYELTPDMVKFIQNEGGSFLASSRGNQNPVEMVDYLVKNNVNILFTIGGDGTLRGAQSIADEIEKRGLKISIVGVPKTIDNDINLIYKTFGFSTAFAKAVDAIESAHAEAMGAPNGIGLVKLMGRHSGFIAANAALASKTVNYVLIPEQDFDLEGPNGFLEHLKKRIVTRGHSVIIVAEGAGQKFFRETEEKDASGNTKLADIGVFLKFKINEYFDREKIEINLKYIDPSYMIRSLKAIPEDVVFCGYLAQNAVHAAMAGKTGLVIGHWNNYFTHVPIALAVQSRKVLITERSSLWRGVLASTGQPASMLNKIQK